MKILAVSGTRADWGLLQPVLTRLRDDARFTLRVLVTGQHLMPGSNSGAAIAAAGITVDHAVDMGLDKTPDGAAPLTAATGKALAGVGAVLAQDRPDLMLVLGDRYEILGAVCAALLARVPVAHIAGGDVTEGAFDDSIRHAITKMSAVHFTTTQGSAARVRQMGEPAAQVFCTGSPGLDMLLGLPDMDRAAFFDSVGLPDRRPTFLITLHPATLSDHNIAMAEAMLKALAYWPQANLLVTGSNADPGAADLVRVIRAFVDGRPDAVFHQSLGSACYAAALRHCDLVLGNSSSGLYEAPSFGIPTVNIGDRQARRERAASVLDCPAEAGAIQDAIKQALAGDWSAVHNPYGDGQAAARVVAHLADITAPERLVRKIFEDLPYATS